jgi:predicted PurR-regulated permease PerM
MQTQKNNRIAAGILIIVFIIAAVVIAWVVWTSINNSLHQALNPLEQTNKSLSTQVSNLLHPTPTIIPDPVTIIHHGGRKSRCF